jgi:tetratricopeptide (TPR) repeat protein
VALVCAGLVLAVAFIYAQTASFGFVAYDDNLFVYENTHVREGLTWDSLHWSLSAGVNKTRGHAGDADYWRPLSFLSHLLDVSLFGLKAGGHHLMSVALHAAAAVLLFLVMRSLTGTLWRAAFVAALFAVHPLHVESVAWIAERKDVLSGLFFVLTLGAHARFAQQRFHWGRHLLMLAAGMMAMMSKPMLVTLPCVLLLVDWWPLNRLNGSSWKRLVIEKLPLFIMAGLTTLLAISGGGSANDVLWAQLPWFYRVGNSMLSLGTYITQTLWPVDLICFYPFPGVHLPVGKTLLSIAALALISGVVFWKRGQRALVVGWLWYLGMLMPVLGLFRQAGDQAHADRYTYLAMIGLSLMVAWPLAEWAQRHRQRRIALAVAASMALLVLTLASRAQVSHWRDTIALWTHAVECAPENFAAHAHLGDALFAASRPTEAMRSYERTLELAPSHVIARRQLGVLLLNSGRIDEAAPHLQRTVQEDARSPDAHAAMAALLQRQGRTPEALQHFEEAANLRPDANAWFNLASALLQAGQAPKAVECLQRALAADAAHAESHFLIGVIAAGGGSRAQAIEHYNAALNANPNHLPSLHNLGWLLATASEDSLRDGAKAVKLLQHALNLPGGSTVHLMHALAAAYAETGRFAEALETARQALSMASTPPLAPLAQQIEAEQRIYATGVPWRE